MCNGVEKYMNPQFLDKLNVIKSFVENSSVKVSEANTLVNALFEFSTFINELEQNSILIVPAPNRSYTRKELHNIFSDTVYPVLLANSFLYGYQKNEHSSTVKTGKLDTSNKQYFCEYISYKSNTKIYALSLIQESVNTAPYFKIAYHENTLSERNITNYLTYRITEIDQVIGQYLKAIKQYKLDS